MRIDESKGFTLKGKGVNLRLPWGLGLANPTSMTPKIIADDGVTRKCWEHWIYTDRQSPTKYQGSYPE